MVALPNPWKVPMVSVAEAGQLLHLSRRSAYRAAAAGELPTIWVAGCARVPVAELYRLLGLPLPGPPGTAPRIVSGQR